MRLAVALGVLASSRSYHPPPETANAAPSEKARRYFPEFPPENVRVQVCESACIADHYIFLADIPDVLQEAASVFADPEKYELRVGAQKRYQTSSSHLGAVHFTVIREMIQGENIFRCGFRRPLESQKPMYETDTLTKEFCVRFCGYFSESDEREGPVGGRKCGKAAREKAMKLIETVTTNPSLPEDAKADLRAFQAWYEEHYGSHAAMKLWLGIGGGILLLIIFLSICGGNQKRVKLP